MWLAMLPARLPIWEYCAKAQASVHRRSWQNVAKSITQDAPHWMVHGHTPATGHTPLPLSNTSP